MNNKRKLISQQSESEKNKRFCSAEWTESNCDGVVLREIENADFVVEEMHEEWLNYDDPGLNFAGKNILQIPSFTCAYAPNYKIGDIVHFQTKRMIPLYQKLISTNR